MYATVEDIMFVNVNMFYAEFRGKLGMNIEHVLVKRFYILFVSAPEKNIYIRVGHFLSILPRPPPVNRG